ncbi:cytochrome P450 [Mycobacterium sp. 3519A]|uniref:cytochrome P450 n=1 Tax=Mycobacterium sp. 3519A TaxID=2057184 RepID=UPI000C7E0216|nr:cytochrome P450 [Mycobacterium sp. 3519A]
MPTITVEDVSRRLIEPAFYADEDAFHEGMTLLRDHAPVVRVDHDPRYQPFWAITSHADVLRIERDHDLFTNAPRTILEAAEVGLKLREMRLAGKGTRNLVHLDGAYHRSMRAVGAEWFRPKVMRELQSTIRALAKRYVDLMADSAECEFVHEVAVAFPGYVIMSLLGLPEADYPMLQRWTRELFGHNDEDTRRGDTSADMVRVLADFTAYFNEVTAYRRAAPADDLASAIANARIDGQLLSEEEASSYYRLIASAGHDTTKACIAGGLLAIIEHPDQHRRLRADLGLLATGVDEMIRWTTPVKSFLRTASADTVVHGIPLAAGSTVAMIYPAANRDPGVFHEPNRFDVGRVDNKHLGFGAGVHFCLGAALARMEISIFFEELIPRLNRIELAGEPCYSSTLFVGGLKHLPIRYRMR